MDFELPLIIIGVIISVLLAIMSTPTNIALTATAIIGVWIVIVIAIAKSR